MRYVWGIHDDRLQLVLVDDALAIGDASANRSVHHAWKIWSGAAESVLASNSELAVGPIPPGELLSSAKLRLVVSASVQTSLTLLVLQKRTCSRIVPLLLCLSSSDGSVWWRIFSGVLVGLGPVYLLALS